MGVCNYKLHIYAYIHTYIPTNVYINTHVSHLMRTGVVYYHLYPIDYVEYFAHAHLKTYLWLEKNLYSNAIRWI